MRQTNAVSGTRRRQSGQRRERWCVSLTQAKQHPPSDPRHKPPHHPSEIKHKRDLLTFITLKYDNIKENTKDFVTLGLS